MLLWFTAKLALLNPQGTHLFKMFKKATKMWANNKCKVMTVVQSETACGKVSCFCINRKTARSKEVLFTCFVTLAIVSKAWGGEES